MAVQHKLTLEQWIGIYQLFKNLPPKTEELQKANDYIETQLANAINNTQLITIDQPIQSGDK